MAAAGGCAAFWGYPEGWPAPAASAQRSLQLLPRLNERPIKRRAIAPTCLGQVGPAGTASPNGLFRLLAW